MNKTITIINGFKNGGNRFSISVACGFRSLGWKVNWIGRRFGGWDILQKGFDEYAPTVTIPGLTIFSSSLHESVTALDNSDIVFFSFGGSTEEEHAFWKPILNDRFAGRFFLFDDNDYSGREWGREETPEFKYKLYLKRETSLAEYRDIYPFVGMSAHPELLVDGGNKDIFCTCLFSASNGNKRIGYHRGKILEGLKRELRHNVYCASDLSYRDYFQLLQRSTVSVSCWGNGYTCYRDFEILSMRVLLAFKRMPNPHLDDFKDMESCIQYNDVKELVRKLWQVMNDRNHLRDMIYRQCEITNRLHLPEHRAREIIMLDGITNFDRSDVSNLYHEVHEALRSGHA